MFAAMWQRSLLFELRSKLIHGRHWLFAGVVLANVSGGVALNKRAVLQKRDGISGFGIAGKSRGDDLVWQILAPGFLKQRLNVGDVSADDGDLFRTGEQEVDG